MFGTTVDARIYGMRLGDLLAWVGWATVALGMWVAPLATAVAFLA